MNKLSKLAVSALAILSSALIFSNAVFAEPEGQANKHAQALSNRPNDASPAGKLRACQARENAIGQRSKHLTQLVTQMLANFDRHAQRVEDYYTTKVVPSGKTVASYDSLVTDIANKKQTVTTTLTAAQNDAAGFSCIGTDPKAQMTKFRQDMQTVKKALKDYRTSIKNLIVAVHSVIGATNRNNQSTESGGKNQ